MSRYECALITGASAGLGAEFARQLAPRCARMVVVARRHDRLQQLCTELATVAPELQVRAITCDLGVAEEREGLIEELRQSPWAPTLLVNNAGMGDYGEFATSSWEKVESLLEVNIAALTHLTHGFLPEMIWKGNGAILNVSSLASVLPIPDVAVYAASKAYVSSFSEALRLEVREHGISVLASCPGPTETEFSSRAARTEGWQDQASRKRFHVPVQAVVSQSLQALAHDRARVYPGWKVAVLAGVLTILPMAVIRILMGRRPRRIGVPER